MPFMKIWPRVRAADVARADRLDVGGAPLGGDLQWPVEEGSPFSLTPPLPDGNGFAFAFWSIVGAVNGSYVSVSKTIEVEVGSTDVIARAWYARPADAPKAGTGVFVDAFDVAAGVFFNDAFVSIVNTDDTVDAPLTSDANQIGLFSTAQTKFAKAYEGVLTKGGDTFYAFDRWEGIAGPALPIAGNLLGATQNVTAQAVAFFSRPAEQRPSATRRLLAMPVAGAWVSWSVTVDGGGPTGGGPIDPWDPLMREIAAGVALADLAAMLDRRLRPEVLKIAAKQVSIGATRLREAIDAAAKVKT